jgi:DnaD/phage-associated family protein
MLLVACDDQGRGDAAPDVVSWEICPNVDEIEQEEIPGLLQEMKEQGMLYLYEDEDGEPLFQIIKWWEYQSPQWARPSRLPAPEGWVDRVRYNLRGGEYAEDNWESPGGFSDGNPPGNPPGKPPGNPPGPTKEEEDKRKEKEVEEEDKSIHNAFQTWERATGTLSPLLSDRLGDLIDEFEEHRQSLPPPAPGADVSGSGWVSAAIREAAESTDRFGMKYVVAILDRWKRDGFEADFKNNNGQGDYAIDFGDE